MKDFCCSNISTTLHVVGKSFVYMSKDKQFGKSIVIHNNVFECLNSSYYDKDWKEPAIGVMFTDEIFIKGNRFKGYTDAIVAFDSFREFSQPTTQIRIKDNEFIKTRDFSIKIVEEKK